MISSGPTLKITPWKCKSAKPPWTLSQAVPKTPRSSSSSSSESDKDENANLEEDEEEVTVNSDLSEDEKVRN